MNNQSIIEAKQQRSQNTQTRLIKALHHCLSQKIFEQISIKELADHANVSVGTFYRRFKNKESLLPLLYQDFGQDLERWVSDAELAACDSLQQQIEWLCKATYVFLKNRKSVFRTLHLNARLNSHLIEADKQVDRQVVYQRLVNLLIQFKKQSKVSKQSIESREYNKRAGVAIFTMINTLLDKVIYPKLTPASASELSAEEFVDQLSRMLFLYLSHD